MSLLMGLRRKVGERRAVAAAPVIAEEGKMKVLRRSKITGREGNVKKDGMSGILGITARLLRKTMLKETGSEVCLLLNGKLLKWKLMFLWAGHAGPDATARAGPLSRKACIRGPVPHAPSRALIGRSAPPANFSGWLPALRWAASTHTECA
jgi:hypothetical protein